jgi:hypothetical protein
LPGAAETADPIRVVDDGMGDPCAGPAGVVVEVGGPGRCADLVVGVVAVVAVGAVRASLGAVVGPLTR